MEDNSEDYAYEDDSVDVVYNNMVTNFTANKNKQTLVQIMIEYCNNPATTPQNIYDLKKELEIRFSRDVRCDYCYKLSTPVNYGCDLR